MKIKKTAVLVWAMMLLFGSASITQAGNTAIQTVTYEVKPVSAINVSGNPQTLVINTAIAGSLPGAVTDSSTTYSITNTGKKQKITAKIDSNMPTGLTLMVNLTAPSGATSAGNVTLTTSDANVVTEIVKLTASNLTITYTFSPASGTLPSPISGTRTVTFTVMNQ